jgi:hypothetical protein
MKRNAKPTRSNYTLGDLILAVSSSTRNKREAVAALTDLINSGRVCLSSDRRARVRFI